MNLFYLPTLIPALKDKHLLLDTNIFLDSFAKPTVFKDFFNILKEADVTLTTIDIVKFELLKGSLNEEKYKKREAAINEFIHDAVLPLTKETYQISYDLIKLYGVEGSSLTITDLFLGACLMQYRKNIYLMTRDTSDFLQSIFDLSFVINAPHNKGIFTYGIYQYTR